MGKGTSNIRHSGPFFVQNLTGSSREDQGLFPATLVIGVAAFGQDAPEERHLTCHLMTEGEIDHEIDQLKQQLETVRREAKRLLVKHREDDDKYLLKHGLPRLPDRPATGKP